MTLIVSVLGGGLVLALGFLLLSSRRAKRSAPEDDIDLPLPGGEEEDGPRRVLIDPRTGKPRAPQRAASEYALVVDEEELHSAHDSRSGEFERTALAIQELIDQGDFDKAFEKYAERLASHENQAFHGGIERRLGKYFMKQKDFEKAARVLEHHVRTQPPAEVEAETFFDLGYINFKSKTLEQSRHYFELFAEKERNPAHSDRARRLVSQLEQAQSGGG